MPWNGLEWDEIRILFRVLSTQDILCLSAGGMSQVRQYKGDIISLSSASASPSVTQIGNSGDAGVCLELCIPIRFN